MMNTVDQIIHNTLLRRQGLRLPSIGALVSERVAGKIASRGEISGPAWRVKFSKNTHNELPSIEVLIERELSIDAESAQILYNRWLIEVNRDNAIVIEGVGRIANGFFTPTKSFAALINPFAGTILKLKGNGVKRTFNTIGIVAASCVVVALVLVGAGFVKLSSLGINYNIQTDVEVEVSAPAPIVAAEPIMPIDSVVVDSCAVVAVRDSAKSVVQTVDVMQNSEQQVSSTITYHIVGGVFSTMENADKCIAAVKKKNDKLPVVKIPFKGGKILVSMYSSQNNDVVEVKKQELLSIFPDVWVYKQELK